MEIEKHLITREIGIDMGHRVTHHGSKCRNLHGHRYTIQATAVGPLFSDGEQQGMVLDFGFLKEIMMHEIDKPCDHGTTLWLDDPWIPQFMSIAQVVDMRDSFKHHEDKYYHEVPEGTFGKLYVVPFVPTAENLAKHWYERLLEPVLHRSDEQAVMHSVKVWETPNCSAEYPINYFQPAARF